MHEGWRVAEVMLPTLMSCRNNNEEKSRRLPSTNQVTRPQRAVVLSVQPRQPYDVMYHTDKSTIQYLYLLPYNTHTDVRHNTICHNTKSRGITGAAIVRRPRSRPES